MVGGATAGAGGDANGAGGGGTTGAGWTNVSMGASISGSMFPSGTGVTGVPGGPGGSLDGVRASWLRRALERVVGMLLVSWNQER